MGYSQTNNSSAAFLFDVPGSSSPLVEQERQIGGTSSEFKPRNEPFGTPALLTSPHAPPTQRPSERVAQTVEHVTFNHGVEGSIPSALTKLIN